MTEKASGSAELCLHDDRIEVGSGGFFYQPPVMLINLTT